METWTRDEAERPGFKRTNYGNVTNVSYNIFVEPSAYSILGKRNGLSAYLTVEKKGTFDIFDFGGNGMVQEYLVLDTGPVTVSDREYAGNAYNVSNPECVGNS
ncbi:uncharacterized protein OCT59_011464 [Rhizophagus irregularis]|uniref:uncharacterized protein n=1 Tax=Rhizophagus irregularis TaxID=588596 RepID=UPI00332F988D|nr:hypothetical protein OCT59_011464 [Rhizophagus irregularis]